MRRAGVTQAQLETLAAGRARPRGARTHGREGRKRAGTRRSRGADWCGRPAPRPRDPGPPAGGRGGGRAPRCPRPASTTRWATTCGRWGWRPSTRPCTWPGSGSRRWTCGRRRARGVRRRRAGVGGRRGDAPPASRDRPGRGLRQPRRRDGPRERGLLPRRLGPLEARGPPRARCLSAGACARGRVRSASTPSGWRRWWWGRRCRRAATFAEYLVRLAEEAEQGSPR